MNTYQERVLQSFRRVQGWFAANPQFVAKDGPASTPALAAQLDGLNGVVLRVSDHAAQQETQLAQSSLVSKDEYDRRRELLAVHMASIAKVARALRGTVPGIGLLTIGRRLSRPTCGSSSRHTTSSGLSIRLLYGQRALQRRMASA